MQLGTEIRLGPDRIVLDGDPAPPRKLAQQPPSPLFGPMVAYLCSNCSALVRHSDICIHCLEVFNMN